MKKKGYVSRILCLLIIALCLTACAGTVREEMPETFEQITEESEQTNTTGENHSSEETASVQESTSQESTSDSFEGNKNTVEPEIKRVVYEGTPFMKSVFAVGSNYIYLCGLDEEENYFLAGMQAEDTTFQKYNIDMPENMRIFRMAVDTAGKCHVLWMSVEDVVIGGQTFSQLSFEQGYITVVDIAGTVESTVDISPIIAGKQINPYRLVVDDEGNYYIDHQEEILKIANTGELVETVFCEGMVESIGVGASGKIYSIYNGADDALKLGYIKDDKMVYCTEIPRFEAMYTNLCPGVDCELLLYNKAGGVLTFESDAGEAELKISETDLPISGQKAVGYGFLGDGRLCLLGQENELTEFYYVP